MGVKLQDLTVLQALCDAASLAAAEAGKYIQSQFEVEHEKRHKEGGDSIASQVVTLVDIKAQEIILEKLQPSIHRYDLGLLTEESQDDGSRMVKECFWCIDPLDGTLPYTEGESGYAVSIALISKGGDPLVGVVYVPDTASLYTATKGTGVQLNQQSFIRKKEPNSRSNLNLFMDRSFMNGPHADEIIAKLSEHQQHEITCNSSFGAVRNALSVMHSDFACYFKFPKNKKGGGSIWDYAATRLFFEELGLVVSDANGNKLHLNNPTTTFMNEVGVLYATDLPLEEFVRSQGLSSDQDK